MAGVGFKNPPPFGADVNADYETWKNELEMWAIVTDLKKEKQALAVTLSLQGQAKRIALELDKETLNKEDGMKTLMKELDKIYGKDETDIAYSVYTNFENFRRAEGQAISEYIIEFERLNYLCKKHKMVFPEAVLAFKLLDKAGLIQSEKQLALTATPKLDFESMKSALKRIFGDGKVSVESSITVKQEVLYTGNQNSYRKFQKPNTSHGKEPRGTNPLDRNGKRTRCGICGSVFHWARDCEHNKEKVKMMEDCKVTMSASNTDIVLMTEAAGAAVIDTACTRTVCGKKWLDDYMDVLDTEAKSKVFEEPTSRTYRFGDGGQVVANKSVTFPAFVNDKECTITADVVDIDLPLLLSKQYLKQAEAVIDTSKDEAMLFGQPIKLELTSSGHYCIDLCRSVSSEMLDDNEALLVIEAKTEGDREKMLRKLHRQFGHATEEKLRKLLSNAGVKDQELFRTLEKVCVQCEICEKFGKTPSRPAVSLPLAKDFNETVSMDLKHLEGTIWMLHIIDVFTRYSSGAIIQSKEGCVIVDKFIKHWIGIFGSPQRIFSDNGGEFDNETVKQMAHNFGIEILATAAYAPWSNGVCERHNLTLAETVKKVKIDMKCSWEIALHWALMAKNCMTNVHGYSAHQLVFGRNPNLPGVLTDKSPALEGCTTSVIVAEHISSMYEARKAFTQSECSERVRRALRKQTRSSRDELYSMGEKVYYKRPDKNEWRGPARVVGQDGVVVFARHGGQLIRVHVCRLMKVKKEDGTPCNVAEDNAVQQDQLGQDETNEDTTAEIPDQPQQERANDHISSAEDTNEKDEVYNDADLRQHRGTDHGSWDTKHLKLGQMVSFTTPEGQEKNGRILRRAGKATGKYKSWYNIECQNEMGETETMSVDFDRVQNFRIEENPCEIQDGQPVYEEDVLITKEDDFKEAKRLELESWIKNDVYDTVEDKGQQTISTRWICTLKEKEGHLTRKARLVARGFEEQGHDEIQKDSPTCASESLKVVLAVIVQHEWSPRSMDIKTAFLQGKEIGRQVYLRPPKEAQLNGKLWLLKKCVYGLNDASLNWYKRVKDAMISYGAKVSKVDPAVFIWSDERTGRLKGVLACHVDDFIWGGIKNFEEDVIEKVRNEFLVGREEERSFSYVGLEIKQREDGVITLDQNKYAANITTIEISKSRSLAKNDELTERERTEMRSKIGQILWVARQTRPDVMFDATYLSGRVKSGKVKDILEVNNVVKRLKTDRLTLKFQKLKGELGLILYSDSSLGNLRDGGSQGGQLLCLRGDGDQINPLWWSSKKIRRVVRSSLAGETLALSDGIDMSIFIATLFTELEEGQADAQKLPVTCRIDCRSLYEALKSTKETSEKRLRLEISGVKQQIERGFVTNVEWVKAENQLADSLTKKGASCLKMMRCLDVGSL